MVLLAEIEARLLSNYTIFHMRQAVMRLLQPWEESSLQVQV